MEEEVGNFCEPRDTKKDEAQAALTDSGQVQPPVTGSMIYPKWNITATISVARQNTRLPLHSYITS